MTNNMTYADLLVNENHDYFRSWIEIIVREFNYVYVISNYRSVLKGFMKEFVHIPIKDNLYSDYEYEKGIMENIIKSLQHNSLVLCSASSFSNIIGHYIYSLDRNITFIDIGTSLNDYIGLSLKHRKYSKKSSSPLKQLLNIVRSRKMKW